ncbi:chemotaxis protein MotA [Jatrophihabitans sp. GAS493]|uniref:motility protein A n=1 Tax=Jatrophihabitans sp. GAS493 TaxID=1907575 RepID=UPI000BB6AC49|nr:MotA/TolQ/ExbB proton channel family protein [Jatrophihabitans sp. GAS493]SOD71327.1 chemotaxis protein MotA [Jatrophihabitans sp. GAS493]
MDPATLIGIGAALAAVFGSMILEGSSPMAIFLPAPLMLVFIGTIGAAVAGGVLPDAKALPKLIKLALTAKVAPPDRSVEILVKLAERARREGLLALEDDVANIEDPFLKRALEMAVDGTDSAAVAEILGAEVDTKRDSDRRGAKVMQDMGGFAPTIGIIGTVIGLIHVLGNLAEPAELGAEIASAFVATLWGVLSANLFWFPMGNRLRRISDMECAQMDLAIEGVLAIQDGSNPRLVEQKLHSLLPPVEQSKKEVA